MENIPQTPTDVLLLPGLLLLFGLVVYGAALGNGLQSGVAPKYRWVGVVLMVAAAGAGLLTVNRLFGADGEFYRAMIGSRKILLVHYVALALPLVVLAGVPVAETWFRRSQMDMR